MFWFLLANGSLILAGRPKELKFIEESISRHLKYHYRLALSQSHDSVSKSRLARVFARGSTYKVLNMSRIAASQLMCQRTSFEEDVITLKQQGYDGVGIWRDKLLEFGVEKGRELLTEVGLTVSSVQWAGGFTGDEHLRYEECIADAQEAIQMASTLEAECLVVYSGGRAGHTRNHCRKLFKEALRRLAPYAAERNVTLGLEPMHPATSSRWSISDSLSEMVEWVEKFNNPFVKLIFDSYHICQDPHWPQWLEEHRSRICLIHLADANEPPSDEQNRCLLGTGHLPLEAFLTKVEAIGYDGFIEVELFGRALEDHQLSKILSHSREAMLGLQP